MKNILVLYSEFNAYNYAAFKKLYDISGMVINVVHWDKTKMTAYTPPSAEGFKFFKRSTLKTRDILNLIDQLSPNLIFVSGWMDRSYTIACRKARRKGIKVVIGFDTHWRGGIRQSLFLIGFRLFRKYLFSNAFVPGNRQYHFARKLGFLDHEIKTGLYTANTDLFKPKTKDNKTIIYIGRLEAAKGAKDLVDAFVRLLKEDDSLRDWKLILVGEGPLRSEFAQFESVTMTGFLNQAQITELVQASGFFCLPSWRDQWGLVIHEMAASGLPLIISNACGAIEEFLIPDFNGSLSKAKSIDDLQVRLQEIMKLAVEQRMEMGRNSELLAQKNSPMIWSRKLLSFIENPSQ